MRQFGFNPSRDAAVRLNGEISRQSLVEPCSLELGQASELAARSDARRSRKRRSGLGRLAALGLMVGASLVAFPAQANPQREAEGLVQQAMDEDYLALEFQAAELKLEQALAKCSPAKCSAEMIARIYHHLGVVYAGGMNRHPEAVEQFKRMLEVDPTMTIDPNFVSDGVQRAFNEAKGGSASSKPSTPDSGSALPNLREEAWAEQTRGVPVPVFVKLPAGIAASSAVTRYREPGGKGWKELNLQPMAGGFGGYIPCPAVRSLGKLTYFTTAFNDNMERVAASGSANAPRQVQIKTRVSGEEPSLPDMDPPERCPSESEARLSCESSADCSGGQVCQDFYCVDSSDEKRSSGLDDEAEGTKPKSSEEPVRNWLSLSFSPDVSVVQSVDDACSPSAQSDGVLSCFFSDGPFTGEPIPDGKSNTLHGGMGAGSMRVMVGYDRLLGERFLAGLRLGFAFMGHPEKADGATFNPFHAELKFAFHFANQPFSSPGIRPYVFFGGGMADSVAKLSTPLRYPLEEGGNRSSRVDVYQYGGGFFAGAGLGAQYAVEKNLALVLEVGVRQAFPTSATIIAPSLGFAYGL